MPKHDNCHDVVAEALQQAGWQVENDFRRSQDDRIAYIDLRAFQLEQNIFVEVKCFPNLASPDEQYTAVGQYLIYQTFLRMMQIDDPLFLAVPVTIYEGAFDEVMLETMRTYQINALIFDETGERSLQ